MFLFPKWRHDYLYAELLSGKTLCFTLQTSSVLPISTHACWYLSLNLSFGGFNREASFGEKLGKIACYCHCSLIVHLSPKTRSHLAKAKTLFDIFHLFFDLLCWFFDLFRFRSSFCLVSIGTYKSWIHHWVAIITKLSKTSIRKFICL